MFYALARVLELTLRPLSAANDEALGNSKRIEPTALARYQRTIVGVAHSFSPVDFPSAQLIVSQCLCTKALWNQFPSAASRCFLRDHQAVPGRVSFPSVKELAGPSGMRHIVDGHNLSRTYKRTEHIINAWHWLIPSEDRTGTLAPFAPEHPSCGEIVRPVRRCRRSQHVTDWPLDWQWYHSGCNEMKVKLHLPFP